jgi:large subunit ribosomal protein L3
MSLSLRGGEQGAEHQPQEFNHRNEKEQAILALLKKTRILTRAFYKTYVPKCIALRRPMGTNRAILRMDLCLYAIARFVIGVMEKPLLIFSILNGMKFIVGTKEGMTQIFDAAGIAYPVTVLRVTPAKVTQVKEPTKDGYEAVQIASGEQKAHRVTRAERGHLGGAFKHVTEFRPRAGKSESVSNFAKDAVLDAGVFAPGDTVVVSAISKGKGFQGVVKRHGFHGAPKSHGVKDMLRAPGSIGGGGRAGGRVAKGKRMAGRMGADRVTVKNLKVVAVNKDENILLVHGAVPGRKGTLVEVRSI